MGHVIQIAGEDAHLVAVSVDLDANTVELPFNRRPADMFHRFRHAGRRGCQHRLHRLQYPKSDTSESLKARGPGNDRSAKDISGEHRSPSHHIERNTGRLRDGIGHDAFEGALAHLSNDQAAQVVLLIMGGPAEEAGDQCGTRRL